MYGLAESIIPVPSSLICRKHSRHYCWVMDRDFGPSSPFRDREPCQKPPEALVCNPIDDTGAGNILNMCPKVPVSARSCSQRSQNKGNVAD